jgi:hypothetical protein
VAVLVHATWAQELLQGVAQCVPSYPQDLARHPYDRQPWLLPWQAAWAVMVAPSPAIIATLTSQYFFMQHLHQKGNQ